MNTVVYCYIIILRGIYPLFDVGQRNYLPIDLQPVAKIKAKIKPFIRAADKLAHARPILIEQAIKCGLIIKEIELDSEVWSQIMELHLRSDIYVNNDNGKLIEAAGLRFSMGITQGGG